jgi:very-short-patch-repair endonuclease
MAMLAYHHHGVVASWQLHSIGLTAREIHHRVAADRLLPVHRGVYAVGHRRLTENGRFMAAVLACGEQAMLSHRSAAVLWRLLDAAATRIDVTVVDRSGRSRPGIAVHRPRRFDDADRGLRFGIPVTSPSRTLLDLAGGVGLSALRDAVDAADRVGLLDLRRLTELLEHAHGIRGTGRLRGLLARYRRLPETRSWLERRFLRLCDDARIPRPAVNVVVEGFEVDCCWPDEKVVVELDGYGFHRDPEAFETDRRRDVALQLAGYKALRFTHARVLRDAARVAEETIQALGSSPGPISLRHR